MFPTNYTLTNHQYIVEKIYKQNLALNNQYGLMYHITKSNRTKTVKPLKLHSGNNIQLLTIKQKSSRAYIFSWYYQRTISKSIQS